MSRYPRPPIAIVAAAAAILAALAAGPPTEAAPKVELRAVDAIERPIAERIDALRRSAGRLPVRYSPGLTHAAEMHAATLARSGTFSHHAPGEKPFTQRLLSYYSARGFVHWATGENIFWARTRVSPDQVVAAWLASPPHKANIYDKLWDEIGVAAIRAPRAPGVYGGRDVTIVVLELGTRRR